VSDRGDADRHRAIDADGGNTLLLAPAGLLILLLLAAVSFDLTAAFQRKRELVELADAAANDAVSAGIDVDRLRAGGSVCLSAERVARVVAATVAVSELQADVVGVALRGADPRCPTEATIALRTRSPYPFGQVVPGTPQAIELTATGSASVVTR